MRDSFDFLKIFKKICRFYYIKSVKLWKGFIELNRLYIYVQLLVLFVLLYEKKSRGYLFIHSIQFIIVPTCEWHEKSHIEFRQNSIKLFYSRTMHCFFRLFSLCVTSYVCVASLWDNQAFILHTCPRRRFSSTTCLLINI